MIALSCGLVAAIGVFQYLDRVRASERVEKKTVLVAAKEININEALNRDNVRSAEWPRAQVPQGALADLKQRVDSHNSPSSNRSKCRRAPSPISSNWKANTLASGSIPASPSCKPR
jgi:Flp pilus assembly protein CpaB